MPSAGRAIQYNPERDAMRPASDCQKTFWCGSTPNASPGGKLSEKRSQRTVFLTEEECGRKSGIREMLGLPMCFVEIQTYFRSISCTNFQITARIPTLAKSRLRRLLAARACGRSLPTPSGPPSPREKGFSRRSAAAGERGSPLRLHFFGYSVGATLGRPPMPNGIGKSHIDQPTNLSS